MGLLHQTWALIDQLGLWRGPAPLVVEQALPNALKPTPVVLMTADRIRDVVGLKGHAGLLVVELVEEDAAFRLREGPQLRSMAHLGACVLLVLVMSGVVLRRRESARVMAFACLLLLYHS